MGLIIDCIAEAVKTSCRWKRGVGGMDGIGGRKKVTLVIEHATTLK